MQAAINKQINIYKRNSRDHPLGGGRGKSKGNRQPCSPWGKLAKGKKTRVKLNPLVIKGRPRR